MAFHSCLVQPVGAEWRIHGGSGRTAIWAPIVARSTDDGSMETAMQSAFVFLRHLRQQISCSCGTCAAEAESTFDQVSKRHCDAHPYLAVGVEMEGVLDDWIHLLQRFSCTYLCPWSRIPAGAWIFLPPDAGQVAAMQWKERETGREERGMNTEVAV